MNKQQIYTLVIVLVIAGLMSSIIISANNNKKAESPQGEVIAELDENSELDAIIYYGIQCPFCKDVDQWIEDNQAEEYLVLEHKEVSQNLANSMELQKAAAGCGYQRNEVGVPFMLANGECYSGKIEIINYLKEQLKLKKDQEQAGTEDVEDLEIEEEIEADTILKNTNEEKKTD